MARTLLLYIWVIVGELCLNNLNYYKCFELTQWFLLQAFLISRMLDKACYILSITPLKNILDINSAKVECAFDIFAAD